MILSLNLRTEHGCPGWFDLSSESKTSQLVFRTKANDKVDAYLGNYGHENDLSKGFAVKKNVLKKQPWCFSKTLYLSANGMMMQAMDGGEYHIPIELGQSLVCVALSVGGELFAYLVVEKSKDNRFRYFPVMNKG